MGRASGGDVGAPAGRGRAVRPGDRAARGGRAGTRRDLRAMRVLMTADAVGGVWTYALELAAALAPHGAQVALAVMGPPPSAAQRTAAAAVPNVTLLEGAFRLEWMDDPWDDVAG